MLRKKGNDRNLSFFLFFFYQNGFALVSCLFFIGLVYVNFPIHWINFEVYVSDFDPVFQSPYRQTTLYRKKEQRQTKKTALIR